MNRMRTRQYGDASRAAIWVGVCVIVLCLLPRSPGASAGAAARSASSAGDSTGHGRSDRGATASAVADSAGNASDSGPTVSSAGNTTGHGQSYWGAIPERGDSVSTAFTNRSRKTWEWVVLAPYQVIDVPIRLVFGGAAAAFKFLDDRRVVQWAIDLFGPRELPYRFELAFRSGGLDRFGAGLTLYHDAFFGDRNRLKLRALYTRSASQRYSLGLMIHEGDDLQMEFGSGYRLRTRARYFGLGPDAREEDESFYEQEAGWVGVSASRRLFDAVRVEAATIYSSVATRSPEEGDTPGVDDRFSPPEQPFGFGERSEGITASLALAFDNTSERGRPHRGTIVRGKAMYFDATDDTDTAFWLLRGDAEKFLPLWHSRRSLALRSYINWMDAEPSEVPFQRLMTNDEPDLFRGYRDFRWRDRGMVGLSAEYRFPVWNLWDIDGAGADAYLFADVGQVFGDFEQITRERLTESYGIGLRAMTIRDFLARVEVAWSEEEVVLRLAFDQIFQYAQGGLYHGREKSLYR